MEGTFNKKLFFCCLIGGSFGLHKFINGEIFMGIVYLLTGGLWGIGVIIDLIRIVTNNYDTPISEIILNFKNYSNTQNVEPKDIVLEPNERCLYTSRAYMYDDREMQNVINMSLDDMDFDGPISYSKTKRKNKLIKNNKTKLIGNFYYTNKRIIFISNGDKIVEEKLENINNIQNMGGYINIFVGKIEHKIYIANSIKFYQIYMENQNISK